MHGQCPIGKDSWCYYQRALSCGKKPNEKYKGLSNEVLNTIKPTYLELCTKELLTKCLHGKTQNSNECLNGVIWQRVPKEVFVCLKILKSGAVDVVIQFNDGYKGCVEIFKKLNITPGYFTLKAYKHLDINRINDAERHSTPNIICDIFENLSDRLGSRHVKTVLCRPRENRTERVNRDLVQMIANYVNDQHDACDQFLREFAYALRTGVNETTEKSPAKLFLGRKSITPF
ncbi:uncharacterized protein TNCV_1637051 [Trichonephila clavipes]|nr:uncharacterized protein TNCV_1637051 [Trichonephila clavipes]